MSKRKSQNIDAIDNDSEIIRNELKSILKKSGHSIINRPSEIIAIISDKYPNMNMEISILRDTLTYKIVHDCIIQSNFDKNSQLHTAQYLVQTKFFSREWAIKAVGWIAYALNQELLLTGNEKIFISDTLPVIETTPAEKLGKNKPHSNETTPLGAPYQNQDSGSEAPPKLPKSYYSEGNTMPINRTQKFKYSAPIIFSVIASLIDIIAVVILLTSNVVYFAVSSSFASYFALELAFLINAVIGLVFAKISDGPVPSYIMGGFSIVGTWYSFALAIFGGAIKTPSGFQGAFVKVIAFLFFGAISVGITLLCRLFISLSKKITSSMD